MPFLKDIVSIITSSLRIRELFGRYENIDYIFTTIHFNYNVQLHDALVPVLNEMFQDYSEVQEINATCLVVPELPCKFLRPVLMQRPLSYTAFRIGNLRQVHSKTYGFTVTSGTDENTYFYRKNVSDQALKACKSNFYGLVEGGNRVSNDGINDVFYLNFKKDFDEDSILIRKSYTYNCMLDKTIKLISNT